MPPPSQAAGKLCEWSSGAAHSRRSAEDGEARVAGEGEGVNLLVGDHRPGQDADTFNFKTGRPRSEGGRGQRGHREVSGGRKMLLPTGDRFTGCALRMCVHICTHGHTHRHTDTDADTDTNSWPLLGVRTRCLLKPSLATCQQTRNRWCPAVPPGPGARPEAVGGPGWERWSCLLRRAPTPVPVTSLPPPVSG